MTEDKVIEMLRVYIVVNFKTQKAYAESKGIKPANVSAVLTGKKRISKAMLDDIGVKKEIIKRVRYTKK